MRDIDPALVREYFIYDPETGELRWKIGSRRRKAGELAGTAVPSEGGRRTLGFKGKLIRAHIVIWAYQTGEWPTLQIDHINEDPSDNKWKNLRLATKSQNMQNITKIKSNSSGYKGVYWAARSKKWAARIQINKKTYYLGLFDSKEDASRAYIGASKRLHGQFSVYLKTCHLGRTDT